MTVFSTCLGKDIILKPSPSLWLCRHPSWSVGSVPNPKRAWALHGTLQPRQDHTSLSHGWWGPQASKGRRSQAFRTLDITRRNDCLAEQHCQMLFCEKQLFLVLSLSTSAVSSKEIFPMDTTTQHAKGNTQGQAPETRQSSSAWRLSVVMSPPRSSLLHVPFLNS